jgi:hypothetical protein
MKEQCVIKQVRISRQGELRVFQIKIPRTAQRIIGIETGIVAMKFSDMEFAGQGYVGQPIQAQRSLVSDLQKVIAPVPRPIPDFRSAFFSSFFFRTELLIGELKLQSLERANIFYAADVYEISRNIQYGDYSADGFIPQAWTHGKKRFEDVVAVNAETTIIEGIFKDRFGERIKRDWPYTVNVYVWYEINDKP